MNQNIRGGGAKQKDAALEERMKLRRNGQVFRSNREYTVVGCRIINTIDIFVNCNWVDTRWQ